MGLATIARPFEDPLEFLPRRPALEFARRQTIYASHQPCEFMYVVRYGHVIIKSAQGEGGETVSRIVGADGLFGETSLIDPARRQESAMALDQVSLMAWGRDEIEQQIERDPRLGIALSHYFVRRCLDLCSRVESQVCKTPERVALALLQLAEALGTPMADGSLRMAPLTHQIIAEYVGTSREIVTSQMVRLRRLGMLRYSREHIDVYAAAMRETLRSQGLSVAPTPDSLKKAAW